MHDIGVNEMEGLIKTMEEWITFHGEATEGITNYELQPTGQAGKGLIAKDAIAFAHGKISLKSGATLIFTEQPESPENMASYVTNHKCSQTYSFGMVEVCADNG